MRKLYRFIVGIDQDEGGLPVDGDLVEEQHLRKAGRVDGAAGGGCGHCCLAAGLALQNGGWLLRQAGHDGHGARVGHHSGASGHTRLAMEKIRCIS